MKTSGKYFFLESLQLRVFTITYILSCFFIFWLLSFFLLQFEALVIIISAILFLILATLGWAYLYTLFSIPRRMAESFDPIKNNISSGKTTSVVKFAEEISDFLIRFYDYAFFDVRYSAIKIGKEKMYFSSEIIEEALDWNEVEKIVSSGEDQISHGRIKIEKRNFYSYTTPVYFGDDLLGFFTVFTANKLGKLRLKLLSDLENFFIDDQWIHVMNLEKSG